MIRRIIVIAAVLCAVSSVSAFAQYPGGVGTTGGNGGYIPPKGGYGSSAGIGIGAGVAAGVVVAYLLLHSRHTVVGCVKQSGEGNRLLSEKNNNTYALLASSDVVLSPGERVALKGKKGKDSSGELTFEAQKLVKDYGACKQ